MKKGFTLVELIVTISIISILSLILAPSVLGMVKKAQEVTDSISTQQLNTMTAISSIDKNVQLTTLFNDCKNDNERYSLIMNTSNLKTPIPAQKDAAFMWDQTKLQWVVAQANADVMLLPKVFNFKTSNIGEIDGFNTSNTINPTRLYLPVSNGATSITIVGNFKGGNIEYVKLPEGYTTIKNGTFENNKITELILPSTLKEIGGNAFKGNDLKSVSIGNGVTIGASAFAENPDLNIVTFGTDVTFQLGQNNMFNYTADGGGNVNRTKNLISLYTDKIKGGPGTYKYTENTNPKLPGTWEKQK